MIWWCTVNEYDEEWRKLWNGVQKCPVPGWKHQQCKQHCSSLFPRVFRLRATAVYSARNAAKCLLRLPLVAATCWSADTAEELSLLKTEHTESSWKESRRRGRREREREREKEKEASAIQRQATKECAYGHCPPSAPKFSCSCCFCFFFFTRISHCRLPGSIMRGEIRFQYLPSLSAILGS